MLGRRSRGPHPAENTAADTGPTLAVYHRSDRIAEHLGELSTSGGVHLEFVRKGTLWTMPTDVAGVLWELTLDDGAQRLVSALISNVPAVSFSLSPQPGLAELSASLGFREHLTLPVRLDVIERALGLRDLVDLADRLDASAGRLSQLAAAPDSVGAILRATTVATDPAGVASAIVAQVSEWVPVAQWFVFSVDPDGVPQLVGQHQAEPSLRSALRSFADVVAQTGVSAVRVTNYLDDRLDHLRRRPSMLEASMVGWPLIAGGTVVGVLLGVDAGRAHRLPAITPAFSDAIARLLEPAAYSLGTALRVARAEALSITDDLTQLHNARHLNEVLRKEVKRAMRSGWPLSLLFVDLDGFKDINDRHGHVLGSRALVEAADIVRASARETDVVARFGGDEFAMLLPETGPDGAHAVARRLRERFERFTFLPGVAPAASMTASIGVATLPDVADTAEGLLQAADAAMYRVKVSGKNGIHVAVPPDAVGPAEE